MAVFAEGGCHMHMSSGPASGRQPAEVLTKCPWSSRSEIFALSRRWLRTSGSKVEPRPVTRSNSRIIEAERGIMINRASRPCSAFLGPPCCSATLQQPAWLGRDGPASSTPRKNLSHALRSDAPLRRRAQVAARPGPHRCDFRDSIPPMPICNMPSYQRHNIMQVASGRAALSPPGPARRIIT